MKQLDFENDSIPKLFLYYGITSVIGVIVFSAYSLADSIFMSRFAGEAALDAAALAQPVLMIFCTVAVTTGAGCNALTAYALGNSDRKRASLCFSTGLYAIIFFSVIMTLAMVIFPAAIADILNAKSAIVKEYCIQYVRVNGAFALFFMLQSFLCCILEVLGCPAYAMLSSVAVSIGNILFDILFVVILDMGIVGAALGNGISALIGSIICILAFVCKKADINLIKDFDFKIFKRMLYNGSSEGLSAASTGVLAFVFNYSILSALGESGLTAFAVVQNVFSFFGNILLGFTGCIIPVAAYNYGAKNFKRINAVIKYSVRAVTVIAVIMTLILVFARHFILAIFGDIDMNTSAVDGFYYSYSVMLLFAGANNIYISYFTSVNNPKTSALLALSHTVILRIGFLILLPVFIGVSGIWQSIFWGEVCSFVIEYVFFNIQ